METSSDAKIITCCKVIALLRSEQLAEGQTLKHTHLVVCLLQPSSVLLLETVTQQPGVTVEWLLPNELEGGGMYREFVYVVCMYRSPRSSCRTHRSSKAAVCVDRTCV